MPTAADEGRHRPGSEAGWEESWQLDFATGDSSLGGSLRLTLRPEERVSWVWCYLVGEGRRLVTVLEHEAPLPRPGALDLRCEGLWTDVVCETPLEHWSVGLEAFGLALDAPADALGDLLGDRVGVGLDLGWEAVGPARADPTVAGYAVPADVHGEVLLGPEVITFDGWGAWAHAWGPQDWWGKPWRSAHGRFDDGTRWHAPASQPTGPGRRPPELAAGCGAGVPEGPPEGGDGGRPAEVAVGPGARGAGGPPEPGADVGSAIVVAETTAGVHGLPVGALVTVGGLEVALDVSHLSPVPLLGPRGRSTLVRALCRTTASDGRTGTAWYTTKQAGPAGPA